MHVRPVRMYRASSFFIVSVKIGNEIVYSAAALLGIYPLSTRFIECYVEKSVRSYNWKSGNYILWGTITSIINLYILSLISFCVFLIQLCCFTVWLKLIREHIIIVSFIPRSDQAYKTNHHVESFKSRYKIRQKRRNISGHTDRKNHLTALI